MRLKVRYDHVFGKIFQRLPVWHEAREPLNVSSCTHTFTKTFSSQNIWPPAGFVQGDRYTVGIACPGRMHRGRPRTIRNSMRGKR